MTIKWLRIFLLRLIVVEFNALTFCMFPEKRSTVEEMAFFTFLRRSFFVSELPTSFLARRWTKHLQAGRKNYFQSGMFISSGKKCYRFIPFLYQWLDKKFKISKLLTFQKMSKVWVQLRILRRLGKSIGLTIKVCTNSLHHFLFEIVSFNLCCTILHVVQSSLSFSHVKSKN